MVYVPPNIHLFTFLKKHNISQFTQTHYKTRKRRRQPLAAERKEHQCGEVLFKDLDDYEFKIIWDRIYKSYYKDEIEYEEIVYTDDQRDLLQDASY